MPYGELRVPACMCTISRFAREHLERGPCLPYCKILSRWLEPTLGICRGDRGEVPRWQCTLLRASGYCPNVGGLVLLDQAPGSCFQEQNVRCSRMAGSIVSHPSFAPWAPHGYSYCRLLQEQSSNPPLSKGRRVDCCLI